MVRCGSRKRRFACVAMRFARLNTVRTTSSDAILRLFHGEAFFFVDGAARPSLPAFG